jgi:adenylate cyclase
MRRLTLRELFAGAALAIGLVVALAVFAFLQHSRREILAASERLRLSAAHRVEEQVTNALRHAEDALDDVERDIHSGAISPDNLGALEVALFGQLADAPHLEEVTFTRATLLAYDANGDARLDPQGRFQLSVFRTPEGRLDTRIVRQTDGSFEAFLRERGNDNAFAGASLVSAGAATDPTDHPTFSVLASETNRGRTLWSDLHFAELDHSRAEPRVILSVQRPVTDGAGHFVGVARVGLLTTDLDAIARVKVDESNPKDPHRVLLLSVSASPTEPARLVARMTSRDKVVSFGDDLRVVPDHPAPEIAALLDGPLVRGLDPKRPSAAGSLLVGSERYLATLEGLSQGNGGTKGWLVAVLVPESYYTRDLVRFEHTLLVVFGATLLLVLAIGASALGAMRRGLGSVTATTTQMRAFDFAPSAARSRVADIDEVMLGLERAKTVVRAMGKYIPVDLVRSLYEKNQEPELGGELREVSLMFTDIEGFTTLSERLPPDELSRRLGDYLEAMTTAVAGTSGTIDKYIGDAVMAFWNAPAKVERHAERACEAVLACKDAARALYASASWNGLPALTTRFGVHTANVMVGHFGARSRLSYTALGDGVNLAARLEPLCKQYGVTTLVSEAIVADAGTRFVFRRVDRVAVKGKTKGIDVYELLGRQGEKIPGADEARRYESAFDAYLARDFTHAIEVLSVDDLAKDPVSVVLLHRCRLLAERPPPADWNGVHVATSK